MYDESDPNSSPILREINTIEDAINKASSMIDMHMKKQDNLSLFPQPYFLVKTLEDKHTPIRKRYPKVKNPDASTPESGDIRYNKASLSEVEKGSIVTLSNGSIELPMIHVLHKKGALGISPYGLPFLEDEGYNFITLDDLGDTGFSIVKHLKRKVIRNPIEEAKKNLSYRDKKKKKTTVGSLAALLEAHDTVKGVFSYFDNRVKNGDYLLDQWMADAYQDSSDALESIEKLIRGLHYNIFDDDTTDEETVENDA